MPFQEFIVDRRIESPEGFNAIQTYRCTLALLTQQQVRPVVSPVMSCRWTLHLP